MMNRRTWFTSLLALPFVPLMLRSAQRAPRVPPKNATLIPPKNATLYIQTENTNPTIQIGEDCPNGWIELRDDAEGRVEYVLVKTPELFEVSSNSKR